MNARARHDVTPLRREGGELVFSAPNGAECRLTPVAETVWRTADGTKSAEDLARVASAAHGSVVPVEAVWAILDGMADSGLLEQRVTPPAGGIGRRGFLRLAAAGLGTLAALGALGAKKASADDEGHHETSVIGWIQEITVGSRTFQPLIQSQRMKSTSPKAVMRVKSKLAFGRM